jgi:ABC-2 type transport system permease protein
MIQSGTAAWFARHESRLAWRDWVAMMTAGKSARRRRVVIGILAFVIAMHVVAYFVVGGFASAALDKQMLIAVTTMVLLSWLLMVSQAMESMTRAFYARSDLDLILASPVAAQELFAVRIATVALTVAAMARPLAGPFIDMLIVRGGWHWLGAYGVIVAMGAAATAFAVALSVALFRAIGPRRTRLAAQVVAAVIGAAFVIGLQVAAILSYGTLSRSDLLQSKTVAAMTPDVGSLMWWPARAVLGDVTALAGVLAVSFILLAAVIALVAPRFGDYAIAATGVGASPASRARRSNGFRVTSPQSRAPPQGMAPAAPRSVARLADADADALSAAAGNSVVAQLRGRRRRAQSARAGAGDGGRPARRRPRLADDLRRRRARSCCDRAGAGARCAARQDRGRVGDHRRGVRAVGPAIAVASPWHAVITGGGIVIAAAAATAIQLWFRTQAKRSQFRRRQISSRVATFAEAFSSIGWAATAAVAAVNLLLAIPPGLIALAVLGGARLLAPRGRES